MPDPLEVRPWACAQSASAFLWKWNKKF